MQDMRRMEWKLKFGVRKWKSNFHRKSTLDDLQVSQVIIFYKSKSLYEKIDPYAGNPVKTEVIELVERYYLDDDLDCSRQSPNKNDVMNVKINGVIEKKIKRFLIRSIKEICDIIMKQNPEGTLFQIQDLSIATKMGINSTFK